MHDNNFLCFGISIFSITCILPNRPFFHCYLSASTLDVIINVIYSISRQNYARWHLVNVVDFRCCRTSVLVV